LDAPTWPQLQAVLRELAAEASAAVLDMAGAGETAVSLAADLRYSGQSFDLTVPFDGDATVEDLIGLFHAAHDRNFGHAEEAAAVQVVSLRASAARAAPVIAMPRQEGAPHAAEARGTVRLFAGGAWHDAGLFDRAALDAGAEFAGPGIVTQSDCTILVPVGWRARVDALRNIRMEHG
jgi:N-methylhydantoinase A